jgi:hypothetical protein
MRRLSGASVSLLWITLFSCIISSAADERLPRIIDSTVTDTLHKEILSIPQDKPPITLPDSFCAAQLLTAKAQLIQLGNFHRMSGISGMLTGAFCIFAGVVMLDKTQLVPLAITSMSLGGVFVGLGMWEIKIGFSLIQSYP